ncbi:MAG TPA: alpha-galactosidase [Thermoanaerobaculia bacterium]|nr:alpha-galactosidase [Thermoanaerobaculia bacterium]
MSRRRTLAVLALLAATRLGSSGLQAAGPARVSFEVATRTWTIGNDQIERTIRLDESGRFRTASFVQLARGRDWTPPEGLSEEFRLTLRRGDGGAAGEDLERTGLDAWRLVSERRELTADGTAELDVHLLDESTGVGVIVHYRCFPEAPVLRTWIDVDNEGPAPVTLTGAEAFSVRVRGDEAPPSVFWVDNFTWDHPDTGFQTNRTELAPGAVSSFTTGPFGTGAAWFALQGTAAGDGLFGGWEWSGTGRLEFAADAAAAGRVSLRAGLAPGRVAHVLAPGESFSAPAGFLGFFTGSWDGAALATRRLVESRFAPPLPGPDFPWVGFDTWGYGFGMDETLVNGLIDRAADLGVETFTLDAGWMERYGDWRPRTGRFDGGISALSDHAHARGLRFGLWMAFGVADPGSEVVQTHPDWVATDDGEPIRGDFGAVVLCLGNPAVRAWAISEIDRVVSEYGVDWLLHDFTVIAPCTNEAHGHQAGDGEWATTAGYYAVLDEIRRRHPKLVIENCWNGGSMFDFGMVRRHDTSNTSDKNTALSSRQAVFGATYVLPPRYAGKYIGDDGTPPAYRFASGLPGGPLLLMGRPDLWDRETEEAAAGAVQLYRKLRPVLRDGSFFRLTGPASDSGWDALMSYDPDEKKGVLLAFRGSGRTAEVTLALRGLPASGAFRLRCETTLGSATLGNGRLWVVSPADEPARGIRIRIPTPFAAAVVQLSEAAPRQEFERPLR